MSPPGGAAGVDPGVSARQEAARHLVTLDDASGAGATQSGLQLQEVGLGARLEVHVVANVPVARAAGVAQTFHDPSHLGHGQSARHLSLSEFNNNSLSLHLDQTKRSWSRLGAT